MSQKYKKYVIFHAYTQQFLLESFSIGVIKWVKSSWMKGEINYVETRRKYP